MAKTKIGPDSSSSTKLITAEVIQEKIYYIRGQRVMLDYDLAEIYGYTTSAFNQQVTRNIEKFEGEDFMFRLNREDLLELSLSQNVISKISSGLNLRSKNLTSSTGSNINLISQNVTSSWGGTRKLPYAFTEQGIYMLMTVLRGELAVEQSRALIRMFKSMKDYIIKNQEQIDYRSNLQLALKVTENTKDIDVVKSELTKLDNEMEVINKKLGDVVMKSEISPIIMDFSKLTEQREFLFLNGQPAKASETYISIYSKAQESIDVIDNYISLKTLRHLCQVKPKVKITIFTDNLGRCLHKNDYNDFIKEFPQIKIKFIKTNNQIHDRFIILDYGKPNEIIYHSGGSEKDAGNKITSIIRFDDDLVKNALHEVVESLKDNRELILK